MPSARRTRKPTSLPLASDYSRQFSKDWHDLVRSGTCNMERLKALVMAIIADDGPLPAIHREHELQGEWAGFHECHMGGDVLLFMSVQRRPSPSPGPEATPSCSRTDLSANQAGVAAAPAFFRTPSRWAMATVSSARFSV